MNDTQRSPLALAILSLLYESPMHPYRMQQLIKERGKDEVINVRQRASLYQTINRLQRDGLIRVREMTREEKRPERTVYELTEEGYQAALAWLRQVLSTPGQEFPEFPAAISFLALLTPEDALRQLETRETLLGREVARLEAEMKRAAAEVPRLFLLEMEYLQATRAVELEWVRGVIGDLSSGRLTWNERWLREVAAHLASDQDREPS
jgi:DNA-binding PadR family transcriptional regulator